MAPRIDDSVICGQHIELVRKVEHIETKLEQHSETLQRVEEKIDTLIAMRQDDDQGAEPSGIPWSWLAKVGGTVGVTVGTAVAAWQGISGVAQ